MTAIREVISSLLLLYVNNKPLQAFMTAFIISFSLALIALFDSKDLKFNSQRVFILRLLPLNLKNNSEQKCFC